MRSSLYVTFARGESTPRINDAPLPLNCCRLLSALHEYSLACAQWWMRVVFIIRCIEGKDLELMCFEMCVILILMYWPCSCSQGSPPKLDPPCPSGLRSGWFFLFFYFFIEYASNNKHVQSTKHIELWHVISSIYKVSHIWGRK